MTHFILAYNADIDRRVPHFLRGAITPVRVNRYDDISLHEIYKQCWDNKLQRYIFNSTLFFISREREIKMDFYPTAGGFLASGRMINILASRVPEAFITTDVTMCHESGRENSHWPMKFCQITTMQSGCDLSKMDIDGTYHMEIDSKNQICEIQGKTIIQNSLYLVLKQNLPEIFISTDIPPSTILISRVIKDLCIEVDLIGPRFISTDDVMVIDFMPGGPGRFFKGKPYWRERSHLKGWGRTVNRASL